MFLNMKLKNIRFSTKLGSREFVKPGSGAIMDEIIEEER